MVTREEILSRLSDVLVEFFDVDRSDVRPSARLFEDLDIDSIDAVDLSVRMEDLTGHKLTADEFRKIRTIAEIIDVVAEARSEQSA